MGLSGRWGLGTYQGKAPLDIMNRILQELQLAQWLERVKAFYMKMYKMLLKGHPLTEWSRPQQHLPAINLYHHPILDDILARPRFRPGPYM